MHSYEAEFWTKHDFTAYEDEQSSPNAKTCFLKLAEDVEAAGRLWADFKIDEWKDWKRGLIHKWMDGRRAALSWDSVPVVATADSPRLFRVRWQRA